MRTWPEIRKTVGKAYTRVEAPRKVTGEVEYTWDVQPRDWLYGMILTAPWASAEVSAIDLGGARKVKGIRAAILIRETPRQVRFYGEELAAVAGVSKQACMDAIRAIRVSAEERPFVVHEAHAALPEAPRVYGDHANLGTPDYSEAGDVDVAMAKSAGVVSGIYATQVQLHQCLETHGVTVAFDGKEAHVWASTQGIFSVRDSLADALGIAQNRVRVVTDHMGGGFGSKFGCGVEGIAAARLSEAAGGVPVKLMLTRRAESLSVGNRPSTFQKVKLGADAEGKLSAYELDGFGCAGYASGGETEGGGGGAGFPASYIYDTPNKRVRMGGVAINAGSGRAFRAPGHPPASFVMESLMDDLAVKLGRDPVEFRLANDDNAVRRAQMRLGAKRFGWSRLYAAPGSAEGPVKRGMGCGCARWDVGGWGSRAIAQINRDGSVEIRIGTQDIGTGTRTIVGMVAAEVLGISREMVEVLIGDTYYPFSGGSGGSTTCPSVSPAVFDASAKALESLKKRSGLDEINESNWKEACGKLGGRPVSEQGEFQPSLASKGAGGVQFAEVEVDTETGFVKLLRMLCVQDCGLIVNPLTTRSQVNGGIIGGIGYALYEQRVMDPLTGKMLNPNFETYKLPGCMDVPPIEVILTDRPNDGVKGVGEPVTIPTASAIANAVANATGKRVMSLPITPAKVLAVLGRAQKSSYGEEMKSLEKAFAHFASVGVKTGGDGGQSH